METILIPTAIVYTQEAATLKAITTTGTFFMIGQVILSIDN